jgi:hypothetical protein
MTSNNWMKHFIGRLLLISHLQWLYRNFTLHNKLRGYLCLQRQKEVLKEVDCLMDTNPDDILQGSQYLLELNFTSFYNSSFKRQSYWVLPIKAAQQGGCRANHKAKSRGASHQWRQARAHKPRTVYNFSRDLAVMNHELQQCPQPRRQPIIHQPISQSFKQEAETGLTMVGRNTHTTHMYEVAFQLVTGQLR